MPTTRRQSAMAEGKIRPDEEHETKKKRTSSTKGRARAPSKSHKAAKEEGCVELKEGIKVSEMGKKRGAEQDIDLIQKEQPVKKAKTDEVSGERMNRYKSGTIERGHIYFFYRPRVQLEEAHSIEDVRNLHMVLVPRPPEFSASYSAAEKDGVKKPDPSEETEAEVKVLAPGADTIPAPEDDKSKKKHYRVITIGKKTLPEPARPGPGESRKKETFWATVTAVGEDLNSLEKGLGEKSYETKTRGMRHEEPARLTARGAYAIVNSQVEMLSERETHLGYYISHPSPNTFGDVQRSLGIHSASSFVLQVKNPLALPTGSQQVHSKGAEYPDWILRDIFGAGEGGEKQSRGREHYGLRFVSCETPELLDYKGAELLLIAARAGEQGLEASLGEDRGKALREVEEKEVDESVQKVFGELGLDVEKFPIEPLEGQWI